MQETLVIHQGYEAPLQARVTVPDDPGYAYSTPRDWFVLDQLGLQREDTVIVNHQTALTYSAVWACVRYISQSIASLGWHVYERLEDDRSKRPVEDDISWLLSVQPNDEMNAFEWRQVTLKDCLLWGNSYSEIERDGMGRPKALWRIDPWRVCVERNSAGQLYYEIQNGASSGPDILFPFEVFHTKGLGPDGLVGYSVIEMARRSIELGMQQDRYGNTFFKRGPLPGGILKLAGHVKEEERKRMRASFEEAYGGARNAGRVVVTTAGTEFVPLSMPNRDSQWIESKGFGVTEIARFYGVPPHKIGDLSRSTFSNVEQQAIEAVQDCLLPWARRLESEADVKLFSRKTRGTRYTRINLGTLLRGDSKTQTENLASQVQGAMRTPNEAREMLDLNPIEGGDELLVQGAMVTLERAIEGEPEPEPAPTPAPEPGQGRQDDDGDGGDDDLRDCFTAILEENCARVIRVETERARKAKRQNELNKWVDSHFPEESQRIYSLEIKSVVMAVLAAVGRGKGDRDAAEIIASLAADHAARSRDRLLLGDGPGDGGWHAKDVAKTLAREQAGRHLAMIWEELKR